jgi:hypothetical protein
MEKYKKLRNKANSMITKEKIGENRRRMDEANNENEFWKIVNDISKPNNEQSWKLVNDKGSTTDEAEIAEELNNFFVEKISKLKDSIDKTLIDEPLIRLKKKMEKKTLNLHLKLSVKNK